MLERFTKKYKDVLRHNEIEWEEEGHTESKILNADVVVKSPGIPDHIPLIQKLQKPLFLWFLKLNLRHYLPTANIIGITGSNGKTTTTLMVHQILKQAGLDVAIGGNIGESFAKQVLNSNANYVLELE